MLTVDLSSLIRARIEDKGSITIKEFLRYISEIQNEHFVPKPSIKKKSTVHSMYNRRSMFGETIADWCINFWKANNKPKKLNIIVFCPRSGVLISKILEQKKEPAFKKAINIHIVEPSSYFTKIQKQNLGNYSSKIKWFDSFEKIPTGMPSIVLANKFFSSLPIEQYTRKRGDWLVNMVSLTPNRQYFCITHLKKLNNNMSQYLDAKYPQVQEGGIIELHDTTSILLKKIVRRIKKFGGIILLLDQGYFDNNKRGFTSTLQATNKKRWAPIFHNIGKSFLSSQLNFSNIKDSIELYGGQVHGPITQRDFLFNMQIDQKKKALLEQLSQYKHTALINEYERLTSPKKLGYLFKVMAICNNFTNVTGFKSDSPGN